MCDILELKWHNKQAGIEDLLVFTNISYDDVFTANYCLCIQSEKHFQHVTANTLTLLAKLQTVT